MSVLVWLLRGSGYKVIFIHLNLLSGQVYSTVLQKIQLAQLKG